MFIEISIGQYIVYLSVSLSSKKKKKKIERKKRNLAPDWTITHSLQPDMTSELMLKMWVGASPDLRIKWAGLEQENRSIYLYKPIIYLPALAGFLGPPVFREYPASWARIG